MKTISFPSRFSFLSHHLSPGSLTSRFVISPLLEQDAGEITCEAANRFGRDQKHFFLSIEGKCLFHTIFRVSLTSLCLMFCRIA